MRKVLSVLLVGIMLAGGVSMGTAAETGRGDVMGFIAGCCFGIRSGAAYNDGKEVHWREWIMLVPIANLVCSIWNGLEGYKGVTSAEYATRYGSTFY
jgi:hypothetical protein